MATPNPLQRWFLDFLRLQGAETEVGERTIEAVLPASLAERTNWRELETFAFTPDAAREAAGGARLVTYDSGVLEAVRPLVEERGLFTEISLAGGSLKTEGLEARLTEEFAFVNGVVRMKGSQESMVPYLLAHFMATAVSEEKREGLVVVALNLLNGSTAEELVPLVERRIAEGEASSYPVGAAPDLTRWSDRLLALARRRARSAFADFEKSLTRRLGRDTERLTDYYTTIAAEIEKKIERKRLAGEEEARERARIEATQRELTAKLADQRARYAMTIRLEPIAFLNLRISALLLHLTLLRRKRSRDVDWVYNSISRQIERPACETCFEPTRRIILCDERLHLLCADCASAHPRNCV